jgi:hypothetical protein
LRRIGPVTPSAGCDSLKATIRAPQNPVRWSGTKQSGEWQRLTSSARPASLATPSRRCAMDHFSSLESSILCKTSFDILLKLPCCQPSSPLSPSCGGNLDGAWVLTSVGSPCGSSTDTVVVTGARMVGQYGTAQVSPNGSTSGIGSAGSLSWTMSGRLSGRSGSGTFRRSDGCVGSWTGSKQ